MYPEKNSHPHASPQSDIFIIYAKSIHYGADAGLTVITAYLHPTPELIQKAQWKLAPKEIGTPIAFIYAYDVEEQTVYLFCIDSEAEQHEYPLDAEEAAILSEQLQRITISLFHKTPEQKLNERRRREGLKPLNPQHKHLRRLT